jgi:hypothetical protein
MFLEAEWRDLDTGNVELDREVGNMNACITVDSRTKRMMMVHCRNDRGYHGFMRIMLIPRVNQLAQGYKKSTFHRYVPISPTIEYELMN